MQHDAELLLEQYHLVAMAGFEHQLGVLWLHGAIDNLARGASAQALQAFNVSQGWADALGLPELPLFP